MYPTHAGSIECTMLALWPHKYKVGHIDHNSYKTPHLLYSPENHEFSYVSQKDKISVNL